MAENENVVNEEACAQANGEQTAEPDTQASDIDALNARNASLSTGKICDDGQGAAFFTAADVRAMSREQVRANLPKILKSMESAEF